MADRAARQRRYRRKVRRENLAQQESDENSSDGNHSEDDFEPESKRAHEVHSDSSDAVSEAEDANSARERSDSEAGGTESVGDESDAEEGFNPDNDFDNGEDFHDQVNEEVLNNNDNNVLIQEVRDNDASDNSGQESDNDGQQQFLDNATDGESGSEQEVSGDSAQETESEADQPDEGSADEEEPYNFNDNNPLYDGARITLKESSLAILAFALSHKLSGVCINDLLSLIELHCGPNNLCMKSLYSFKKYFSILGNNNIIRNYYCSVCENPLQSKQSICDQCNGAHPVSFFIECPIVPQLQSMYKRPGFYESLSFKSNRTKKKEDNLEDVYDSKVYKEITDSGFLSNPNNISFNLYFDGVSIFKSSKFSLWPCCLSINELKYNQRTKKQNIILAGIWFGKSKPNPNLFFDPLCKTMTTFENEGVDFQLPNGLLVRVRGSILSTVADLPAKALFMRMIQFNGSHSCFNCLSSGARVEAGRGAVHVFPYSRNMVPRNRADMEEFVNLVLVARETDRNACVYGVKGRSSLFDLLPDVIRCLCIDVMHGVFLGLMKTLLDLWFSTEHNNRPFNISALIDVVDARLKRIKPPYSFQRIPRSIRKELALFKAADFKVFFFYFSVPLLYGVLPDLYWEHHCKVVTAIALLTQESISPEQINIAEELLHDYVSEFQQLYELRYMGLNVHQLLHLCEVVRNLGPTWAFACFFYESLNGDLVRLVHGTRYAALQICAASAVLMKLPVMVNQMNEGEAKSLSLRFMNAGKRMLNTNEIVDEESYVVGKYTPCNRVTPHVLNLLLDKFNILNGRFQYFLKLKKGSNVFCSEMYDRAQKKMSCFVEIFSDGVPKLCKIKSFIRWSSCEPDCPERCMDCDKIFVCIVALYEKIPWRLHELGNNISISYLDKVTLTDNIDAFNVNSIRSACLYIPVQEDADYMCVPVNSLEIE